MPEMVLFSNRPNAEPVPVNTPAEILDICNKVREAGGGELLEALMPSDPSEPDSCLIANSLNFNCRVVTTALFVDYDRDQWAWAMEVDNRPLAAKIAEVLDTAFAWSTYGHAWHILLPAPLGNAARAFDLRLLPEEYYA